MDQTTITVGQRRRLSLSLYLNYVVHGFGLLILAQNMTNLASSWGVTIKMVSFIISGVGIGRLLAYLITGYWADRLSRKLFVYLGMACYFVFAVGMVMSPSIPVAYVLAILAGVANSALDAGTYTTFVEMNNGNGQFNVLLRAVVSVGEFILPLLVSFFSHDGRWYGWTFLIMAGLLAINAVLLMPIRFPKRPEVASSLKQDRQERKNNPGRLIASGAFVIYGYVSMALMIWFTQWVTLFGENSQHYTASQSHWLLSLYSIGSILGVLTLFILLGRNVGEAKIIIAMNLIATGSLIMLVLSHQLVVAEITSFIFGFSAASGVMQTGLTLFMKLYPQHRGMVTGVFYFFGAIASFTVPIITGILSDISIQIAFAGDIVIGIVAVLMAIIIALATRNIKFVS